MRLAYRRGRAGDAKPEAVSDPLGSGFEAGGRWNLDFSGWTLEVGRSRLGAPLRRATRSWVVMPDGNEVECISRDLTA